MMRRNFWVLGCIFMVITLFSCDRYQSTLERSTTLKQIKVKPEKIYFDTIFSDGVRFYCDYTRGILSFVWWKNDSTYFEGKLDSFKIDKTDLMPKMDFPFEAINDESLINKGFLFRGDGLILFGYYYLPHNVCLYHIHEDSLFFGKKYLSGKWFYPKISMDNKSMMVVNEDHNKEKDPADDMVFLKAEKIYLEDFPKYSDQSIKFTNKDIFYDCLQEAINLDSCLWMNMLSSNAKIRNFVSSK